MLTTLISAVQGALGNFTRGFLVVTFIPVMLFVAVNVAIASVVCPGLLPASAVAAGFADGIKTALWMVGTGAAALVFGALQPVLFRLTEGDHMPEWMRRWWHASHQKRLDALRWEAARVYERRQKFDKATPRWRAALALPESGGVVPTQTSQDLVGSLAKLRSRSEPIEPGQIEAAVTSMSADLQAAGANVVPKALRDLRREFQRVIGYARDRSLYDYRQIQNRIQASFPGNVFDPEPSSDNILAPTTFGNVGRTMRSYALRRYGLDLDIFWNRLQKVMEDSTTSKMFASMQGQKTQVDFLVNLLWLTVLLGAWMPVLFLEGMHPRLFLTVAIAVPVLAYILYQTACRAYLIFADQVRTAVDYFRSDILAGLRIKLPVGTDDEMRLWERLGDRIGYARKDAAFLYAPPK
jgi:hypothetical protein